ncbi:MAG TPA: crosslink repair DNA glycosylase YcaQ family protein [Blastocatellia bacterium]|nr:crosslink repair DNA glycosylase YcaQ family protein [Blastocatellia bacterium]
MSPENLTLNEARRIALTGQGFDRLRPNGKVNANHIRGVIRRLGLVQIDYVNVLTPAHYQVLFSRLGSYDKSLFDDLVYRRREFTEQWAHERSILPVESWPLLRHRMETHRVRPWGFEKFLEQQSSYVAWALEEIRARGPLSAEDLPEPDGMPRRMSDKWGWGMNLKSQVLEAHFGFGRLAVVERLPNFTRVYDLAERVIPAEHHGRKVEREEAQRELLRLAARSHGISTAGDLADYYRMRIGEARRRIAELVGAGELREARVEGWREPAYLHPDARIARRIEASALLSPFDPVVWNRTRAARLFGFDYRIEIFTPQEKRRWGYYVLPFLLGERLVARVDLTADRAASRLLTLAAYIEAGADPGAVAHALAAELWTMARWLGLDSVYVERRNGFARPLEAAVRAHAG